MTFELIIPYFCNIKEYTSWTNEGTLNDNLGHGVLVVSFVNGRDVECLRFALATEIYVFWMLKDVWGSYTSWFIDAFNWMVPSRSWVSIHLV